MVSRLFSYAMRIVFGFVFLTLCFLGDAIAQTSGIYSTGTGYSISVEFEEDSLIVVEPNKRSEYKMTGPNVYEFTNTNNNNIRYGIRVIDANTLEAFKPGSSQPGTKLTLMNAQGDQQGSTVTAPEQEKFEELASEYLSLAQTDPVNVQVWSACGAVAFSRSSMSTADADVYARQTASMLKLIMIDSYRSPCPEVIPNGIWAVAN